MNGLPFTREIDMHSSTSPPSFHPGRQLILPRLFGSFLLAISSGLLWHFGSSYLPESWKTSGPLAAVAAAGITGCGNLSEHNIQDATFRKNQPERRVLARR
jgi:hypothetical protein